MPYSDIHLTCKECGRGFVWTADQQKDYDRRGFKNQPARCPECRIRARETRENIATEIICSTCGRKSKVMFEIKKDRPIYCQECFDKLRKNQI